MKNKEFQKLHENYHRGKCTKEEMYLKWREDEKRLKKGKRAECRFCK